MAWAFRHSIMVGIAVLGALFAASLPVHAEHQVHWWPLQVKSFYGHYDVETKRPGHAAESLDRPKLEVWVPPEKPDESYTIGVCIPHVKDAYWVTLNYGIIDEARRLGVSVHFVEAGGYGELETQLEQMRSMRRAGVDGIILGAVSYSGNDVSIGLAEKSGIPVVEVVNDVSAPLVTAKSLVSFYEMGYFAGEYVAEHAEKHGLLNIRTVFLPRAPGFGMGSETLDGFRDAVAFFPGRVEIADVRWGDTGKGVQRALLSASLAAAGRVDYVVGNAVAAELAADVLEERGEADDTFVVGTYLTPGLYGEIEAGRVAGAPSDLTVFQGRMAVDMMVRVLEGATAGVDIPFRSGPFIPLVTPDNLESYPYEGLFGPRDYEPVFNLTQER